MTGRAEQLVRARQLAVAAYDRDALMGHLRGEVPTWRYRPCDYDTAKLLRAAAVTLDVLDGLPGKTTAQRWEAFEDTVWSRWRAGVDRPPLGNVWTWGTRALACSRLVTPQWAFISTIFATKWVARLPDDDPLSTASAQLTGAAAELRFGTPAFRSLAVNMGLRLMFFRGLDELSGLSEEDLIVPDNAKGGDLLDAMLCALGVFDRTPRRGIWRRLSTERHTPAELAVVAGVPEPFTEVAGLYLETYARRVSDGYNTLRSKATAIAHFFNYLRETHPEITSTAAVTPRHAKGFILRALAGATGQRGRLKGSTEITTSAYSRVVEVRSFFTDLCAWATEEDSPLADHAPPAVPFSRRDLLDTGLKKARQRSDARIVSLVLDLSREIPNIRAYALRTWHEADKVIRERPEDRAAETAERVAFWDWALLELLLTSGLRIEEACELTTLDVIRRHLPDGRLYYLLHVKPSKFGRARVVPIGDQLGRVIGEIIRHIRRFYATDAVPACDRRDEHEKRPLPTAPYLLQGRTHPSALNTNTIRGRLKTVSLAAGARHGDGRPLELTPHDCRRVFASEHLNADTPVHVIQALLGHATVNTVMIYAKLYPRELVEGYRRAMRGLYADVYGPDANRNPDPDEWAAFTASCSLRDMGTHICALPTGEHCPRGLVCLGCGHAQPKRSAVPTFRRMLASHSRALERAAEIGEPAGQIAARELEVDRIRSALQRAEELTEDVASAIEASAEGRPGACQVKMDLVSETQQVSFLPTVGSRRR